MAVSVAASKKGLHKIDLARRKKGWTKIDDAWCKLANTSKATLKRFWQGKAIQKEAFELLCKVVGIDDWGELVDSNPTQEPTACMEFYVYDEKWVGREKLIGELAEKLSPAGACRILLLVGITGIGKTAFAEKLVEELRGELIESRENFEKQEQESLDFASTALKWLETWGENIPQEEQRQPQQLLKHLLKRLCTYRHLILMDSLEYLLEGNEEDNWGDFSDNYWRKFFVSLLQESSCQSRLILTSQDLPTQFETAECDRYKNLWCYQLLRGLEPSEQMELFQKAGMNTAIEPSISLLKTIGDVYDGHPLTLIVIAGEIKESYAQNIQAYWKANGHYIESVKKALEEAKEGTVEGKGDHWQLDSYTKCLRRKVKERFEKVFERLKKDVYGAYFLLCTASIYRCEVPESWWLTHLEYRGDSKEQQNLAMQTLRDRYLVEDKGIDSDAERLIAQHNLIRSMAIAHRLKLFS